MTFQFNNRLPMRWSLLIIILFASSVMAGQDLPPEIKKIVQDAGFDTLGIGLYIQAVDAETPLVSYEADKPLNPASVMKLLTTATAIDLLGGGYKWSTNVWYKGELVADTLNGDLYFSGNGDPYLTPERFWRLLNRIAIFGIRHIKGNIYLDSSYFDMAPVDYAAFDEQPYRTYNVGPNALLVGFQATEFHFNARNGKVMITPFPDSPKLKLVNEVKLIKGPCGAWQKRLKLETKHVEQMQQVTISGRYARACDKRTMYRRVTEADDHFRHFFLPLWRQIGGEFDGKIRHATVPSDAVLAIEGESITLSEAIRLINKFSNNVMTRQILLTLGAKFHGVPGTTEKGIAVVMQWMKDRGLDTKQINMENGAGLSRDGRVTAKLLGELLLYIYRQPYMPEFMSSLPVSGFDGTMGHRFRNDPITGRAHMKTGLLDFVQTMAGYVLDASGKHYVVALLHNHPRAHTKAGVKLQDDIIRWVYQR